MSVKVFPPSLAGVPMLNLTLASPFHDIKGGEKARRREGAFCFRSPPCVSAALCSPALRSPPF